MSIEDTARRVLTMYAMRDNGTESWSVVSGRRSFLHDAAPDLAREVLRLLAVETAAQAYRDVMATWQKTYTGFSHTDNRPDECFDAQHRLFTALVATDPDDERTESSVSDA